MLNRCLLLIWMVSAALPVSAKDVRPRVHPEYRVDRGFKEYLHVFGHPFLKALKHLRRGAHVVDFGAGDGHFILQLGGLEQSSATHVPKRGFRLTAITFETDIQSKVHALSTLTKDAPARTARIEIFQGRLFSQIPLSELKARFGPADLGVDVWGIMAYTHTPTEDLKKIHDFLRPGASYFLTESTDHEGNPKSMVGSISFDEYLQTRLKGFDVRVDSRRRTLILTRNSEAFSFPHLQYVGLIDGREAVPVRRFFRED